MRVAPVRRAVVGGASVALTCRRPSFKHAAVTTRVKFSHTIRMVAALTALSVFAGCASSTVINSSPQGARLYLNGEPAGTTPYTLTDTRIVGATTTVRLEHPGYEVLHTVLVRNEEFQIGPCIGGVLVLVPFLWIMGYKPTHTYELRPTGPVPGYAPGFLPPSSPPQGTPGATGPAYQPHQQQGYPQQQAYPQQTTPPAAVGPAPRPRPATVQPKR